MIEKVETFKKRLEIALLARHMRPVDLAKKTGISESTISQYRSGYAEPKEERLALIANALRVNPTWLMGLNVPSDISNVDSFDYNIKLPDNTEATLEAKVLNGYINADDLTKNMIERLLNIEKEVNDGNGSQTT